MLTRWIALKWAREPWKWALLVLVMALWPAIQAFAPFGASPTEAAGHDLIYEVAFVAGSLGAACALDALEVLPSCSYALGLHPGWWTEWIAMLAAGTLVQVATLAIPLAAAGEWDVRFDFALAAHVLVSAGLFASFALLLLRVRIPVGLRAPAFLVLTWIMPAIVPTSYGPRLFATDQRPTLEDFSARTLVAGRIASIFALLLGAHLLDARRRQRP